MYTNTKVKLYEPQPLTGQNQETSAFEIPHMYFWLTSSHQVTLLTVRTKSVMQAMQNNFKRATRCGVMQYYRIRGKKLFIVLLWQQTLNYFLTTGLPNRGQKPSTIGKQSL